MIEIRLLGPVQVFQNERRVSGFRSQKTLALLGYLVLRPYPIARATLTGLFWGEFKETEARQELRRVLHNLSKLVPGCFEINRKTVAFLPEQGRVDTNLFMTLSQSADFSEKQQAIALYHGELLQGIFLPDAVEFEIWLLREREHWQQRIVHLLQEVAQHWIKQENHSRGLEIIGRLLEFDPWNEQIHRQKMRLLALEGQWNAALAQYETCRQLLDDELGVGPMPETIALYERIKRARSAVRHNLPHIPSTFVGRTAEITDLLTLLKDPLCRLVTLKGSGGIGKTRLAIVVAERLSHFFLEGVRFVPLISVTYEQAFITAIATAVGVSVSGQKPIKQQLLDALRQREMLLVLDNLDHLSEQANLIAEWIAEAPDLKVLITSRQQMALKAERVYTLKGLPYQALSDTADESIASIALFRQRAQRVQRHFNLTKHYQFVLDICRRLEGLPLGIELAAALVVERSCEEIAQALEASYDVLESPWHDQSSRHRTLRAIFEQSWQSLSQPEQQCLQRMAVFQDGFKVEAAKAVLDGASPLLRALIHKSLVQFDPDSYRYLLNPVIQAYAFEKLGMKTAKKKQCLQAHALFYADWLAGHNPVTLDSRLISQAVRAIDQEIANCRRAWEWMVEEAAWPQLYACDLAFARFYQRRGWQEEGVMRFKTAVSRLRKHSEGLEGEALAAWGNLLASTAALLTVTGQISEAQTHINESINLLKSIDLQHDRLPFALNVCGVVQIYLGHSAMAERVFLEMISLLEILGRPDEQIGAWVNLGSLYGRNGRYKDALEAFERGLILCRTVQDRWAESIFLQNLGAIYAKENRLEKAESFYLAALPVCDEVRNWSTKATALNNLGELYVGARRWTEAQTMCLGSLELAQKSNNATQVAWTRRMLGIIDLELGRTEESRNQIVQGLQVALETKSPATILELLDGVARWLLAVQRLEDATLLIDLLVRHPATDAEVRMKAQALLPDDPIADQVPYTPEDLEQIAYKWLNILKCGAPPQTRDIILKHA